MSDGALFFFSSFADVWSVRRLHSVHSPPPADSLGARWRLVWLASLFRLLAASSPSPARSSLFIYIIWPSNSATDERIGLQCLVLRSTLFEVRSYRVSCCAGGRTQTYCVLCVCPEVGSRSHLSQCFAYATLCVSLSSFSLTLTLHCRRKYTNILCAVCLFRGRLFGVTPDCALLLRRALSLSSLSITLLPFRSSTDVGHCSRMLEQSISWIQPFSSSRPPSLHFPLCFGFCSFFLTPSVCILGQPLLVCPSSLSSLTL